MSMNNTKDDSEIIDPVSLTLVWALQLGDE